MGVLYTCFSEAYKTIKNIMLRLVERPASNETPITYI